MPLDRLQSYTADEYQKNFGAGLPTINQPTSEGAGGSLYAQTPGDFQAFLKTLPTSSDPNNPGGFWYDPSANTVNRYVESNPRAGGFGSNFFDPILAIGGAALGAGALSGALAGAPAAAAATPAAATPAISDAALGELGINTALPAGGGTGFLAANPLQEAMLTVPQGMAGAGAPIPPAAGGGGIMPGEAGYGAALNAINAGNPAYLNVPGTNIPAPQGGQPAGQAPGQPAGQAPGVQTGITSPQAPASPTSGGAAAPGGAPTGAGTSPIAQAAQQAGQTAGTSFVDNLIKQFKDNALGLGLQVGALALSAGGSGGQKAGQQLIQQTEAQMGSLSDTARTTATNLINAYNTGQIQPGQQAQLDQLARNTKNQLRNYFASINQSDSTAAVQAEAQVDEQTQIMKQNMLDNMLQTGLQAIGIAEGPLSQIAQYQLGQDQNLRQAFGAFAQGVGNLFGRQAGTSPTTQNTVGVTPTGTDLASAVTASGGPG